MLLYDSWNGRHASRHTYTALSLVALLSAVLAGAVSMAGPAAAAPTPSYLADGTDPAVTSLAAERRISIAEAQRRVGWQQPATAMSEELSTALGERFGGLWFDDITGRVEVGIVAGSDAGPRARAIAARWHLSAVTDLVPVATSYPQLERDSAWLGSQLRLANSSATTQLSSALLPDRNLVELRLPHAAALTADQTDLVERARKRLGARLTTGTWSGAISRTACRVVVTGDCDAPLRGGVSLYLSDGNRDADCTTAFNVRSRKDGKWYVMTAGHCGVKETEFSAYQWRTGQYHVIGRVHNSVNEGNDDYGMISINNVAGWNPKPWVWVQAWGDPAHGGTAANEAYVIKGVRTSPKGTRVCMTGAYSGTSCGNVVALNIGGAGGYAQADYCTTFGDSGGAVFSAGYARGINVGVLRGYPFCKAAVFQGVIEAADALDVNVLTG